MEREVVTEGASVEEAIDAALEELGVQQDAVEYEVLDEPGRKVFGVGSGRPARVRVRLKQSFLREMEEAEREAGAAEVPAAEEAAGGDGAPPHAEHSVEEVDRVADEASGVIREVLSGFGMEAQIDEYEGDEGEVILDIVGDDLAVLIGRHGRTLDAFQVLVSAITNKRVGFRHPVLVDVSGYRYRRKAKLEEIAARAAERASRQGRAVPLRPMSSYERRLVHIALREDRRVTTSSEGEEPFRHVVVLPR
ncbi:MAG: Jag N-terminal domain-containing protein [Coriobacteriia bacterium]|nr:Jag N-terminal domain-containing protein [Coriobacteriia bacterium]